MLAARKSAALIGNTPEWLEQTLRAAAEAFDRAFDRWRELYAAAERQRDESRLVVDNPTTDRKERANAERREE